VRHHFLLSLAIVAFAALPGAALASQTIDRNAKNVHLGVNRNNLALITYRAKGKLHHVLAWGAINARTPTRGAKQVRVKIDYSGGWGSRRKDVWRTFHNACGPYQGPELEWIVTACTAPDGSNWALQSWQRLLPPFGLHPTSAQAAHELQLSHWTGDLPEFVVKQDWVYKQYDHLYGWLKYRGKGVYGFKNTRFGAPLDSWGRNVFVDTYNSRYGPGWKRENGFLTHRGSDGAFCYGFYPHGNRPVGRGEAYRATVMGPGVTPIVSWTAPALGAFDPTIDDAANQEQDTLFKRTKCHVN